MAIRFILKKQLSYLSSKFIVGCIGPSEELSMNISPKLIELTESKLGPIENILPINDFPNPPESYFKEMGLKPLSTTIFILKKSGSYSDLHHIKKITSKLESELENSNGQRYFNINPGAIGRYGLILASHKPTGKRPDINTYAYGIFPHLFFTKPDTYYERIMRWEDGKLILLGDNAAFSEYKTTERMNYFEKMVASLGGKSSIELMVDSEKFEHDKNSIYSLRKCFSLE